MNTDEPGKWHPADGVITVKNVTAIFRREVTPGEVLTIKAIGTQLATDSIGVVPAG